MEAASNFIKENKEKPYPYGILNRENSIRFIQICIKNHIRILGFDGFHRRADLGPDRIQIDSAYTCDFSGLDKPQAYQKALDFFSQHSEDILYEFVYDNN